MKAIEAAFNYYREKVIPADAPDVQVDECRRAFFAGVKTMFDLVGMIAQTDDSEDTVAEQAGILEALAKEIDEYGEEQDQRSELLSIKVQ